MIDLSVDHVGSDSIKLHQVSCHSENLFQLIEGYYEIYKSEGS